MRLKKEYDKLQQLCKTKACSSESGKSKIFAGASSNVGYKGSGCDSDDPKK